MHLRMLIRHKVSRCIIGRMSTEMRAFPVFILAIIATVAAACHSSNKVSQTACTDEAATQQAAASGATPSAQGTDDELTCRIREVSLTAADMPDGWTFTQSGGLPVGQGAKGACGVTYRFKAVGPKQYFSYAGDAKKVLTEIIFVFEHDAARKLVGSARQGCGFPAASSGEGDATTPPSSQPQYHEVQLPSLGDESMAYRVDVSGGLPVYDSLIRRGDVVMGLSGTGITPDEFGAIAKVAYKKIADSGSYVQSAVK